MTTLRRSLVLWRVPTPAGKTRSTVSPGTTPPPDDQFAVADQSPFSPNPPDQTCVAAYAGRAPNIQPRPTSTSERASARSTTAVCGVVGAGRHRTAADIPRLPERHSDENWFVHSERRGR